jgi:hypothetical protein
VLAGTIKQNSDAERADGDSPQASSRLSSDIEKVSGEADVPPTLQNEDEVSWLTLLQCLHQSYSSYRATYPSDKKRMSADTKYLNGKPLKRDRATVHQNSGYAKGDSRPEAYTYQGANTNVKSENALG